MKKTATAMLALTVGIMAASCQKEAEPDIKSFEPMTINAVSEGIGTATKTEMAYKYDILWSEDDQIYVTDGTSNDTFTLSAGEGTTKGTFTQNGKATFTSDVKAYYPATMVQDGGLVWPATQTNDQTIPMYCSKTVSGKVEDFNFSSLGSVLQIVFNTTQAGVTLQSIEIKDGSKTMSGEFTVNNGIAEITATDKAGITLDLGTGKALGKGANYFNIAVPAGDYKDLTLVFTATDGAKCTMTKGKVNIACNTVGRLTLTGETFKPDVPEGALSGVFTVGPNATDKVHFSQGNLVATIDAAGTPTAWKFAANQYDCLGEGGANKTIGTAAGDVDLFGWSTESTTYGISTSTNYSGDFVDWGKNIGDGSTWRTLSKDEWGYLIETRTNASSLYKKGVTVCGKTNCVIIAPDNWDISANPLQTSYDATAWATAEAAGLVCIPAAGRRDGSTVVGVGGRGNYWSSTADGDSHVCFVLFSSGHVNPDDRDLRRYGYSVRLITESN